MASVYPCIFYFVSSSRLQAVFPLIFRIVAAAPLIPATLSFAVLTVAHPLKVSGETRSAQHLCHSSFNQTSRQARVGSLASVYRASRDYTISAPLLMNIRAKFRQKRPFPTALATVLESFNCSCRPKAFERVPSRNWDKIFPQCSYQLHTPYLK
ncbi:hypothetical protein HID58_045827 [Brassica napus]|uniref:Secreted protein n=1 Tax=Brassica napus TaxID=3708 RepID=A0ABQ8AUP2_BRANA|nr:hypothetical protein HID58_045827 [Brassica napus]